MAASLNVPGLSKETVDLVVKRVHRRMRMKAGTREAWFVNAEGKSVLLRFDVEAFTFSWRYGERPEFVECIRDFREQVRAKKDGKNASH